MSQWGIASLLVLLGVRTPYGVGQGASRDRRFQLAQPTQALLSCPRRCAAAQTATGVPVTLQACFQS